MAQRSSDIGIRVPPGWALDGEGKTIGVRLKLRDFQAAIGLVNEVAAIAEALDHHPDLHLTSWNRLEVRTFTHSAGALTDKDRTLAERINGLLAEKGLRPE